MSTITTELHERAANTAIWAFIEHHKRLPTVAECDQLAVVVYERHPLLYDPAALKTALSAERARVIAALPFDIE